MDHERDGTPVTATQIDATAFLHGGDATLRDRCRLVLILGNHEEMMLSFIDGKPQPDDWLHFGGIETVESYRDANGKACPVPKEQLEFIRTWGDFFETPSHFFVHGSYEPEAALTRQR